MALGDRFFAPGLSGGDVNDSSPPYGTVERQGSGNRATFKIVESTADQPRRHELWMPRYDGTSDRSRCLGNMPWNPERGRMYWYGYAIKLHTGFKLGTQVADSGSTGTYTVLWSFTISGSGPGCGVDLDAKDGGSFKSDRQTTHGWTDGAGANTLWLGLAPVNQWVYFLCGIRFTSNVSTDSDPNRIYFRKDNAADAWVEKGRSRYQTVVQTGNIRHRAGIYQGDGIDHDRTISFVEAVGDTQPDADVSTLFGGTAVEPAPEPAPTRVDLSTLDDPLDNLTAWTENSGSPSVANSVVSIPPGSEIKRPPTYDVADDRFIVEGFTGASASTPDTVDLLKMRLTVIAGANNGDRIGVYWRQAYGAAETIQLVVGPSSTDTGIVEVPAPAVKPAYLAVGFSGQQFVAEIAESLSGPWTPLASREIPASIDFATQAAKVAVGAAVMGGSSAVTAATVSRVVGQSRAADPTPARRTKTRSFVQGDRLVFSRGSLAGSEPLTFAALVKKPDQTARTFGGVSLNADGSGLGRNLRYTGTDAMYYDGPIGGIGVALTFPITDYVLEVGGKDAAGSSTTSLFDFATKTWTHGTPQTVSVSAASSGKLLIGAGSSSSSLAENLMVGDIAVFGAVNKILSTTEREALITADGAMTLLSLWASAGFTDVNGAEVWDLTEDAPTRRVGTSVLETTTGTTLNTAASVPWEVDLTAAPSLTNFQGPGTDPSNPVWTFESTGGALESLRSRLISAEPEMPVVTGDWIVHTLDTRTITPGTNLAVGDYTLEVEADNAHPDPALRVTRSWTVTVTGGTGAALNFLFNPNPLHIGAHAAGSTFPVEVSVDSGGAVPFTVVETSPWLSVSPLAATTPAVLQVTVSRQGLPRGTHEALISVSADTVA